MKKSVCIGKSPITDTRDPIKMTRLFCGLFLALILSACNVDLVLPLEDEDDGVVTVIDLNARTQNRAVVSDQ
jgi:hypothetical protein